MEMVVVVVVVVMILMMIRTGNSLQIICTNKLKANVILIGKVKKLFEHLTPANNLCI
jgi:hypothetical protein